MRAGPGFRRRTQADIAKEKEQGVAMERKSGDVQAAEGPEETPAGQEATDELEMSVRREEEAKKKQMVDDDSILPPETAEDLRPFPLNKHFRSQPVLSEDLREAIYQRVVRDGATVSLASVEFGVSNERVAAVVRLKQVEKEWVAEVCLHHFLLMIICSLHDETLYNIRLVFKTSHMVTKLYYALSESTTLSLLSISQKRKQAVC